MVHGGLLSHDPSGMEVLDRGVQVLGREAAGQASTIQNGEGRGPQLHVHLDGMGC